MDRTTPRDQEVPNDTTLALTRRGFGASVAGLVGMSALAGCQPDHEIGSIGSTASALTAGTNTIKAIVTGQANETRISNTTFTTSAALGGIPLVHSTTYRVEAALCPWSHGAGGFQMRFFLNGQVANTQGISNGVADGVYAFGSLYNPTANGANSALVSMGFSEAYGTKAWAMSAGNILWMRISGSITTLPSFVDGTNLDFQWAQLTSDPNATDLCAGSCWISVTKLT